MLLDDFLPEFDVTEKHAIVADAPPAQTLAAARALAPRDLPLTVGLMALRTLPAFLAGQRTDLLGRDLELPVVDRFVKAGFALLAEGPDEFVVGGIGRFWKPGGDLRRVTPGDFRAFSEPGYAKTAFNMRVTPYGDRAAILTTETRISGTDDAARRGFGRYWRVISVGSAAIRVEWLRAIRRRAERASGR